MINLHHLVDALPPVVGSMVTLWAVASPRHWFWRSCIVFAFLLLFLLIPAHELIIAGAAQTAVVVGGMLVWRYRRQRTEASTATADPTQISLRTIFLFTIIFAAAMALLGQFPEAPTSIWIRWMGPGITAGFVTLFAVWLVLGKPRLAFRIFAACALVLLTTATLAWMMTASNATHGWTEMWWLTFETVFSQAWLEKVAQRWLYFLPAIATGFISVAAWTLLFRKTGWFNPFGESESKKSRRLWVYRASWLLITATISALPLFLFVNLISWPSLSPDDGLERPYFAHFNAAGAMISDADSKIFADAENQPTKILTDRVRANESALVRMRLGFDIKGEDKPPVLRDTTAATNLQKLLAARIELSMRSNDPQLIYDANYDFLFLSYYLCSYYYGPYLDQWNLEEIWKVWEVMPLAKRQDLVEKVWRLESRVPEWPIYKELLDARDKKEHWQYRLSRVVQQWQGPDQYENDRKWYLATRARIRLILLGMAINSFKITNGRLPKSLIEMTPEFISDIPLDPFDEEPLRYLQNEKDYILYSIGPYGIDDQGQGDDIRLYLPVRPATPTTP